MSEPYVRRWKVANFCRSKDRHYAQFVHADGTTNMVMVPNAGLDSQLEVARFLVTVLMFDSEDAEEFELSLDSMERQARKRAMDRLISESTTTI